MRPGVHADRSDTRDRDAVRTMLSRAHCAHENTVGDAGPVWIALAAIDTPRISGDGFQKLLAGSWKGSTVRMNVIGGGVIVTTKCFQLVGDFSKKVRIFCALDVCHICLVFFG